MGEISYTTKAMAAVLQLAVTMDYSIFLWHSYNEQREKVSDPNEAMANAIHATLTSVVGSSATTIAGFAALCFMSFTLGKDLGLVMAKGVLLGVLGCVTLLPSLILLLDRPLQKTRHRPLIRNANGFAKGITKAFPVMLVIFALLVYPALYGYQKTNDEVYYDMGQCLPQDIDYVIANNKLIDDFDIASTHMVLVDTSLSSKELRAMQDEMENVDGVRYVLSLQSVLGSRVPAEVLPDSVRTIVESDKWQLWLISSEYRVVNTVSIIAVFLIILLVEKSLTLPFILIAVIELAIFINLGLPHYLCQSLPFIAPICISTIQLGATVDYAILMTTRYKAERVGGKAKREAVTTALGASVPSILVSGLGLFAATFGVALYSDMDIIRSMCMLMARGALVSMGCVLLFLPALLMLLDKVVCKTTLGMKVKN